MTKPTTEETSLPSSSSFSSSSSSSISFPTTPSAMVNNLLRRLLSRLHLRRFRRSHRPLSKPNHLAKSSSFSSSKSRNGVVHPNSSSTPLPPPPRRPIRVATFNASLFSMAPAVPPNPDNSPTVTRTGSCRAFSPFSPLDRPKSILKQSPLHPTADPKPTNSIPRHTDQKLTATATRSGLRRVSINLPDNEISLGRSRRHTAFSDSVDALEKPDLCGRRELTWTASLPTTAVVRGDRTVLDVLRELDADVVALQEVKADEEKEMKPLSALADALGMRYVFAESWAPEYGNAVLSKWPIKRSRVQKIVDDSDFRNVLKTTIDVPSVGEVNFYCTHLDHLDEGWRMKQIDSIIESNDAPHILVGGLNSLDETDYSQERWTDIVKYYEEIGKPTPKAEVMRFLKTKRYTDAKDFAGEWESVVVVAKGQSVQGTCKYGTRIDYILSSPGSPYRFVPGSYSVFSSKGTSDHHIVTVDLEKVISPTEDRVRSINNGVQGQIKIDNHNRSGGVQYATNVKRQRVQKKKKGGGGEDVKMTKSDNVGRSSSTSTSMYAGIRRVDADKNPIYIV